MFLFRFGFVSVCVLFCVCSVQTVFKQVVNFVLDRTVLILITKDKDLDFDDLYLN